MKHSLRLASLLVFCFVALGTGCDNQQSRANDPPTRANRQPYQRFVPINYAPANLIGVPWSGAFALDTKTGSLCRTYDWEVGKSSAAILNQLPLCNDLFVTSPDD